MTGVGGEAERDRLGRRGVEEGVNVVVKGVVKVAWIRGRGDLVSLWNGLLGMMEDDEAMGVGVDGMFERPPKPNPELDPGVETLPNRANPDDMLVGVLGAPPAPPKPNPTLFMAELK